MVVGTHTRGVWIKVPGPGTNAWANGAHDGAPRSLALARRTHTTKKTKERALKM